MAKVDGTDQHGSRRRHLLGAQDANTAEEREDHVPNRPHDEPVPEAIEQSSAQDIRSASVKSNSGGGCSLPLAIRLTSRPIQGANL